MRSTRHRSVPQARRQWVARIGALTIFCLAAGTLSCGDITGPSHDVFRDPSSVSALMIDSAAPMLAADSVGFWAVDGKDRSVDIYFADSGAVPSARLLHFEVGHSSLDRYPDGRKFKHNDSVFISIRAADPSTLSFDFEPAGLKFKSDHPATLTINYGRTVPDSVAAPDETALSLWVQEQTAKPYKKITSSVDTIAKEITGGVPGFSKYAVAY
ncbi:MAG: hypothetical protein ABI613_09585 [Gemmatimonadota bacterium]